MCLNDCHPQSEIGNDVDHAASERYSLAVASDNQQGNDLLKNFTAMDVYSLWQANS